MRKAILFFLIAAQTFVAAPVDGQSGKQSKANYHGIRAGGQIQMGEYDGVGALFIGWYKKSSARIFIRPFINAGVGEHSIYCDIGCDPYRSNSYYVGYADGGGTLHMDLKYLSLRVNSGMYLVGLDLKGGAFFTVGVGTGRIFKWLDAQVNVGIQNGTNGPGGSGGIGLGYTFMGKK